jgi:hypothetical protein
MYFLINGPRTRRVRHRRKAGKVDKRRRRRYLSSRTHKKLVRRSASPASARPARGLSMARRRRRTRRRSASGRFVSAARTNPRKRRRHRRTVMAFSTNPRRRRRRRTFRANARRHTRRRFRRNPSFGRLSGVGAMVMQGVKDGGAVFAGQVAGRKLGAGLNAMLPATVLASSPAARGILSRLAGALGVSIAARKVVPNYARFVTAGAFSEVINFAVSQNATAASFLSAYSRRAVPVARVSGYPRAAALPAGRPGVRAYPRSVGMPTMVS